MAGCVGEVGLCNVYVCVGVWLGLCNMYVCGGGGMSDFFYIHAHHLFIPGGTLRF